MIQDNRFNFGEHMNDLEKFKKLMDSFGVEYEEDNSGDRIILNFIEGNDKVLGYSGFYTTFAFTKDGNFIEMGAWE